MGLIFMDNLVVFSIFLQMLIILTKKANGFSELFQFQQFDILLHYESHFVVCFDNSNLLLLFMGNGHGCVTF